MARIRITIDCEESHKRAFLAAASIAGKSPQEFFQEMVEKFCPDDLRRARAALGEPEPEDEGKKPGRRRKPSEE